MTIDKFHTVDVWAFLRFSGALDAKDRSCGWGAGDLGNMIYARTKPLCWRYVLSVILITPDGLGKTDWLPELDAVEPRARDSAVGRRIGRKDMVSFRFIVGLVVILSDA